MTDFIIVTNSKQGGVIVCHSFRLLRLRAVTSPYFSEKKKRTTARSVLVFQSIQFLNVTRLVASG